MGRKITISMYRLQLHGLYGLYGPSFPLSPERPLNLIIHSLTPNPLHPTPHTVLLVHSTLPHLPSSHPLHPYPPHIPWKRQEGEVTHVSLAVRGYNDSATRRTSVHVLPCVEVSATTTTQTLYTRLWGVNLLISPGQYGLNFTDYVFKCIFINKKFRILIRISLKFVPRGPIDNKSALVRVLARHRRGDKPVSEPKLTQSIDAYVWH